MRDGGKENAATPLSGQAGDHHGKPAGLTQPCLSCRLSCLFVLSGCWSSFLFFPASRPGRTCDISFFIYEIKILIVAFNGIGHQDRGFTIPGFGFLANAPMGVDEIQVFLVVPFQVEFLDLLCHTRLEVTSSRPDARYLSGMTVFAPPRFGLMVHFDGLLTGREYQPNDGWIEFVFLLMQISLLVFEPQGEGAQGPLLTKVFRAERGWQEADQMVLAVSSLITMAAHVPGKYPDIIVIVGQAVLTLGHKHQVLRNFFITVNRRVEDKERHNPLAFSILRNIDGNINVEQTP